MAAKRRDPALSQAGLARALGVHAGTVRRWVRKGCPRNSDGSFDVEAVRAWVQDMRATGRQKAVEKIHGGYDEDDAPVEDLGGGSSDAAREKRDVDAQYKKLRAALLALELKTKRAELVPRSEIETMLVSRMQTFKRALRALARRIAPELVNVPDVREIQTKLAKAHDDLLWDAYGGRDGDDR